MEKIKMLVSDSEKDSEDKNIIRHADYDKESKTFYANFYFPDIKFVLKTPLFSLENETSYDDFIFERFKLFKYTYLVFY